MVFYLLKEADPFHGVNHAAFGGGRAERAPTGNRARGSSAVRAAFGGGRAERAPTGNRARGSSGKK